MIYFSASLWMAAAVLLAWGVRAIWRGVISPRALNIALLPGTLIAQLGMIVAILMTEKELVPVSFLGEEEPDEDEKSEAPRVPFLQAVLVGLLPLVTVGAAVTLILIGPGAGLLEPVSADHVSLSPPQDISAFWTQIRHLVTLTEETLNSLRLRDWGSWPTWLLTYLLVCLVMQLAPPARSSYGRFYAIALVGVAGSLVGTLVPAFPNVILAAWPRLVFVCGLLLLILTASLFLRGGVAVVRDFLK